ncbi:MAG: ABC transporter permease subunit [Pirellulales bacterium]|nr:ABC transporter permease subunit [Pirellulales bacterium]
MIREPIQLRTRVILGIASVCLLLVAYGWLSHRQHRANPKDTTVPGLRQFVQGWGRLVHADAAGHVWIIEDARATYGRLLAGLVCGVALATLVGMAMGCFAAAEAFFHPPLSLLAKIPPTAMLAVYFVLVGTEMKMYVAMISLGIFPTLAQAIHQAAKKDVSDHAICKAYTLGASHFEAIWNVVFRQILPRILENVRLQVGPAMVFLIAAEWAVSDVGFGYRLRIQSRLLNMNVVYTYLVILAATGFAMDGALSYVRRKCCPWFGQ